ncbi:SPX, N-terminal [Kalmanozyma brasiliensis GHG001]|uniref:SPX, N-terminal n=1 Tax=Kalmanozyma brasiliensis (strain GHG001) TaxID=1365824 RepID=UPI002868158A|nr:SPX, N-terminal [Kalmanozyma brasiliensis GHG001]KAF6767559.1 SPX, N-terminal [Kalmanozyma brasiliensis GHG001]
MKFGKTYMETMADPAFPEEWRNGALEYKHLKKLINGVVAELESIGLGADVLRELLVRPEDESGSSSHDSPRVKTKPLPDHTDDPESALADESGDSSEQEDADASSKKLTPAGKWVSDFSVEMIRRGSSPATRLGVTDGQESQVAGTNEASASTSQAPPKASALLAVPTSPKPRSLSQGVQELNSSVDKMQLQSEARGRASFSSGSPSNSSHWAGLGRKDLAAMGLNKRTSSAHAADANGHFHEPSPGTHDWSASKWREEAKLDWDPSSGPAKNGRSTLSPPARSQKERSASPAKHRWVEGKFGRRARAEYELGGTPDHPVPRIRLFVESPLPSDDEEEEDDHATNGDGGSISDDNSSQKSLEEKIIELPASTTRRFSSIPEDGPEGETREQKAQRQSEIRRRRGTRSREVVIPLTADTQFLDTLTHALQNLSNIQSHQRDNFVVETESLCSAIARASSPFASKNDLYVWREIFGLWVDMQVFESQREKDRGELSIDESEARLKRFAVELAKRGWIHDPNAPAASTKKGRLVKLKLGSGPSSQGLNNQASAAAIEDFLRLNFALLDVKKFQRVNVEAARKILKKHDKRTALTASNDLRAFMAQQEAARRAMGINPVGSGGVISLPASAFQHATDVSNANSTALVSSAAHPSLAALLPSATTGILSESLPHILLSLVTTTLLPILPAVDDYSCAICTSVAWRPVKLDCSHLFCLRCLVKLQRQGKDDCPLCRAPGAVKTADRRNMDEESDKYLQTWFPREVKEKSKDNEKERRKEDLEAMGLREKECVIQ